MVRQRSRPGYMTRARALSLLQRARTKVIATLTVGCPAAWAISGWSSKPTFSQLTAVLLALRTDSWPIRDCAEGQER